MTMDKLSEIREWFRRHEADRCACVTGPPEAWAEYMAWLLAEVDPVRATGREVDARVLEDEWRAQEDR